jgi:hypothetical protein
VIFHDIAKYKDLRPFENYLHTKTVKNSGGNEQGISDITFELVSPGGKPYKGPSSKCGEVPKEKTTEEVGNPFYYISVKGYKREKNAAKDYDITLLGQQIKALPGVNNNHIVVCVRNKPQFLKGLGRSRMEFLKNSIDHVIGYDEVIEAFSTFRTNFFLKGVEINSIFPQKSVYKPSLSLYFHQELVVKSVVERIREKPNPSTPYFLCVGVLPRGGKSFIAGGIIDLHQKLKGKDTYNVLFLTSAINETRDQFKEDLIDKYSEFKDFQFVDVVNAIKKPTLKKFNFIFVSRQLASKDTEGQDVSVVSEGDLVSRLKKVLKSDLSYDLCFFDEAHIGINSTLVRDQFTEIFKQFKIPVVLMTATYRKPATVINEDSDLFVWDLQDIKDMKDLPTLKLSGFIQNNPDVLQRYPRIAQEILQRRIDLGQTEEEIARPYLQFPSPNFISLTFAPEEIKHLKDTGLGYDYMSAFKINSNPELLRDSERYMDWHSLLVNPENTLRIRQFLTPEQEDKDEFLSEKQRKYRAFNQIFSIAQRTGSRPLIGKPFSVLMFLPFGEGLPIGELCRIWGSFLLQSRYWKNNFVVMTLSAYAGHVVTPSFTITSAVERGICHYEDLKKAGYSLKAAINQVEQEALKYGKGLVLLSGDVAKMGISLKCVDVVCLMSNNTDPDDIIQKMYRALTDDPPMKKNGFIIDLNLTRVVKAMFDYDMEKSRRTKTNKTIDPKERTNKLMELCNWGQDAYMIDNPDKTFEDVMNHIRNTVFANIENRIAREYGSRSLVDNQFKVIQDRPILLDRVVNVLKFTTGKRAKAKKETLLERGIEIPRTNAAQGEQKEGDEQTETRGEDLPEPLSIEQIKKKIVDIMITFVNALVIKSNEPWDNMKFETLIKKYNESKASATRICGCVDTQECGTTFSNLYDIVFCELKSYAMLETSKKIRKEFPYSKPDLTYAEKAAERATIYQKGKKEDDDEEENESNLKTQKGEPIYDEETHMRIMNLMDDIFAESSSLAPDWTNYIASLIQDISKQKPPTRKGGEQLYKTKKNKPTVKDNNVHTTKRNHSRDN